MSDKTLPKRLEECTVNLLIGVDIPEASQHEEIRKGESGEPFAVKTKFGWTLNGPPRENEVATAQCCMMTKSQTTDLLSKQLQKYFNHESDKRVSDDRRLISANDKRALMIFEEKTKMRDGHYVIAIPWQIPEPCLPNNRWVAESQLQYLRKETAKEQRTSN